MKKMLFKAGWYLENPEITIQNDLEILKGKIISICIKPICLNMCLFESELCNWWKTAIFKSLEWDTGGKAGPRGVAADLVGPGMLENQEKETFAGKHFEEESYLSDDQKKRK